MNLKKRKIQINVITRQIVGLTVVLLLLFAMGCTAANSDTAPETKPTIEAEQSAGAEVQTYIRLSREALAKALTVDESEIELESVVEPELPDTAYIITFTADNQHYEYHGRDGEVLLVSNPLPLAPETAVHTEADLVTQLEAAGAQIALNSEPIAAANIVSVSGHIIYANGEPLQVYIYDDAALAQADAGELEAAPPLLDENVPAHIYRWNNIIVLYVGEDSDTLAQLATVMGEPFVS